MTTGLALSFKGKGVNVMDELLLEVMRRLQAESDAQITPEVTEVTEVTKKIFEPTEEFMVIEYLP